MPEFLSLPADSRREIITTVAANTGRSALVLEKDVWICWALDVLFTIPGRPDMAFKGGTSLSKVFDAIERFSEDVDVTLDHRSLIAALDPFEDGKSGKQKTRDSEALKAAVRDYVHGTIKPAIDAALDAMALEDGWTTEADNTGEKLWIYYPSAFDRGESEYVSEGVLLEFGGRMITEPNLDRTVTPYLAPEVPTLDFPTATVTVLAPERTFWEKVTLAHAEHGRPVVAARNLERMSRHWYDLYMLADHEIGRSAVADRALLADVVRYKKLFFNSATADYDACLANDVRLVPTGDLLESLRADYEAMVESAMIYGDPPSYAAILDRLESLQEEINASA